MYSIKMFATGGKPRMQQNANCQLDHNPKREQGIESIPFLPRESGCWFSEPRKRKRLAFTHIYSNYEKENERTDREVGHRW
jgi:hypothetical protein